MNLPKPNYGNITGQPVKQDAGENNISLGSMNKTVHEAIIDIIDDLSKTGIGKKNFNKQQEYHFRGIDDVYAALSPLLAKHGIIICPRVLSREVSERTTKYGSAIFSVVLCIEFTIYGRGGDSFTCITYGEAMDSGDKATNKAMSAAYKYLCLLLFCIPTGSASQDADAETHEVAALFTYSDAIESLEKAEDEKQLKTAWVKINEHKKTYSESEMDNLLAKKDQMKSSYKKGAQDEQ